MEKHFPTIIRYPIKGNNLVETVRYTKPGEIRDKGLVWINNTQYFEGVPLEVWNFYLGGYQMSLKWLKDREGFYLSDQDIQHYQCILFILQETIEIMTGIEETVQHYQLNKKKIFEKIRAIVAQQVGCEQSKVTLVSNFPKELGVDSINMLQLLLLIEMTFNMELPVEVTEKFVTVQQVVEYISQKFTG